MKTNKSKNGKKGNQEKDIEQANVRPYIFECFLTFSLHTSLQKNSHHVVNGRDGSNILPHTLLARICARSQKVSRAKFMRPINTLFLFSCVENISSKVPLWSSRFHIYISPYSVIYIYL